LVDLANVPGGLSSLRAPLATFVGNACSSLFESIDDSGDDTPGHWIG
jgi:hypothetical protein